VGEEIIEGGESAARGGCERNGNGGCYGHSAASNGGGYFNLPLSPSGFDSIAHSEALRASVPVHNLGR